MKEKDNIIAEFFNEILLFSGQYAFFYIIMNFSKDHLSYFANIGHSLLLLILIAQTAFLVKYGKKPLPRFLGSMIAPLFYTALELREGPEFVLNIGHLFFWIFSFITGLLQAVELKTTKQNVKLILEFVITTINITIFLFIYFYFDLTLTYNEELAQGKITAEDVKEYLEIYFINKGLSDFLADAAHIYVIAGGIILSISLSVGRVKIIQLKEKINELFGKYVDKGIRDRILAAGEEKSEKKEIAILFSDIRDFTSISENNDPDAITKMLNFYFTEWDSIVIKNNGIIDKYIGDAVMVLFGVDDNSHSCNDAVSCAAAILGNLDNVNAGLRNRGLPEIKRIGIGINFGGIIIGDIGSGNRKNYTVIGDNVNIASRLESQCKIYNTDLIISESTYKRLDDAVKIGFKFLDTTELKGKAEKISIYGRYEINKQKTGHSL